MSVEDAQSKVNFLNNNAKEVKMESYEDIYVKDADEEAANQKFEIKAGTDVYGNELPAISEISPIYTYDKTSKIIFGEDNSVFGLPYKYSPLADPLMRVYRETFEKDSSICYIMFGKTKLNRYLYKKLSSDISSGDADFSIGFVNCIASIFTGDDPNLISFKSDFNEFYLHAVASATEVWIAMGLPGAFDWDENFNENFEKGGVPFYCTKNTSISEELSNEYAASNIVEQANANAQQQRENYQVTGTYGSTGDDSMMSTLETWIGEKIQETVTSIPIVGNVASIFMKVNRGAMQFYADLWANSKATTGVSLNFKFCTPYGNKLDIFRNVYFPFLLLYTASLPKQNGKYSYKEPFAVRINFPGWFYIECGVIESMSWVKGGDNQLWSAESLPLEINVTLTIRDLYPTRMSSKSITTINYNRGLLAYLQNMGGANILQISTRSFTKNLNRTYQHFRNYISGLVRFPGDKISDIMNNLAGMVNY